jgi:hypothetical protein
VTGFPERLTNVHIYGAVDETLYTRDKADAPYPPDVLYLPDTVARTAGVMGKMPWPPRSAKSRSVIASRMVRMPRSGIHLSAETIEKVKALLSTTDLSMVEIAERIDCSRSAVASINTKYRIRIYGKKRSSWTLNKDFRDKP